MLIGDSLSDGTNILSVADIDHPTPRRRLPLSGVGTSMLQLSRDDQWIAAMVTVKGQREIVVLPFSGTGATVPVSSRGGTWPFWSRTESKLYFQRDDEVMVATYSTAGGRFSVDSEKTLFPLGGYNLEDLGPDGRFLLSKKTPGQDIKIQVIVNWFGEIAK
jgi:hypothetical protein